MNRVSIIADEDLSDHIPDAGEISEEADEMRHHAEEAFWLRMIRNQRNTRGQ